MLLEAKDDDLRDRLTKQLDRGGEISRAHFDAEMQRIWQAIDTHSHTFNEPAVPQQAIPLVSAPQVMEELLVRDLRTGQMVMEEVAV